MNGRRRAVLAGGLATAISTAVLFVAPILLPVTALKMALFRLTGAWLFGNPATPARLLGGIPGGLVAGYLAGHGEGGEDWEGGLVASVYAALLGLGLLYSVYVAYNLVHATVVGGFFPPPVYVILVVPLIFVIPLFPVHLVEGIVAGVVGVGLRGIREGTLSRPTARGVAGVVTSVAKGAVGSPPRAAPTGGEGEGDDRDDGAPDPSRVDELAERAVYAPDRADFDALIAVLDADDPAVRERSVRAIANVPAGSLDRVTDAVPALVRRLDDDLVVRQHAARALARIAERHPEAVRPAVDDLVPLLGTFNVWVRDAATRAVAAVATASPTIATAVRPSLDDGDPAVRGAAVEVLAAVAAEHPEAVVPSADDLRRLLDRDSFNRGRLVRALAHIADAEPGAVAPAASRLVDCLDADEPEPRDHAALAIARVAAHDPEAVRGAVPALVAYLADEDAGRPGAAADALRRIVAAHPDAAEDAADAIGDYDYWGRRRVARAFAADDPVETDAIDAILGEADVFAGRP